MLNLASKKVIVTAHMPSYQKKKRTWRERLKGKWWRAYEKDDVVWEVDGVVYMHPRVYEIFKSICKEENNSKAIG